MSLDNDLHKRLEDDVLDLSLMQLVDVPVTKIAAIPQGKTLDLSNNLITFLPESFPMLTHLVKIDLSKNQLLELPEFFGQMKNLRHLDLYSNRLERLPVSFAQLKKLKWLDLKKNPLVPALQQAAGPCVTANDCTLCAKKVVALLLSMQSQLERERERRAIEEKKVESLRRAEEEAGRERLRAEKKAAKEKRREEARIKEDSKRRFDQGVPNEESMSEHVVRYQNVNDYKNGKICRSSLFAGDTITGTGIKVVHSDSRRCSFLWDVLFFILALFLVFAGVSISILFVYTGGNMNQMSIEKALPHIEEDIKNNWLGKAFIAVYMDLKRRHLRLVRYLSPQYALVYKYACSLWRDGTLYLKNSIEFMWLKSRPFFLNLGEMVLNVLYTGSLCLKDVKIYTDFAWHEFLNVWQSFKATLETWIM